MWLHKSARGMVSTRGFCEPHLPSARAPMTCSPGAWLNPHVLGLYQPGLVWKKPAAHSHGLPSL